MACYLKTKTLIDISNQLKLKGKNVVLTHGSFDLLHIGHMEYIKECKKLGDYLIVGIDSDERVKKYKGLNRPIIPLEQRIEVLFENKSIDFIFSLDDSLDMTNKYFINLYNKFNPSLVTYGGQFAFQKDMEERKRLMKNCKFTQILPKNNRVQSTTKIIEEIIKRYSVN